MTAADPLRDALADGMHITVTPFHTIKIGGEPGAVRQWAAVLREHKPRVMDALALPAAMAAEFGPVKLVDAPGGLSTENSKGACAGIEGTSEGDPVDLATLRSKAMRALRRLHRAHMHRLSAAGIEGVARVRLSDWLSAFRSDRDLFPDIVSHLEQSAAILREHGYARPATAQPERCYASFPRYDCRRSRSAYAVDPSKGRRRKDGAEEPVVRAQSADRELITPPLSPDIGGQMNRENREISKTLPLSIRVGNLDTIQGLRKELGRLYRAARRGAGPEPDAATAAKLAYLLQAIGRSLEGAELERRVVALERAAR